MPWQVAYCTKRMAQERNSGTGRVATVVPRTYSRI
jgi:hypothetical protein